MEKQLNKIINKNIYLDYDLITIWKDTKEVEVNLDN